MFKKRKHEEEGVNHESPLAPVASDPEPVEQAAAVAEEAKVDAPAQAPAPKKYRVKTEKTISLAGQMQRYKKGDILDPAGYGPQFAVLQGALDLEEV